MPIYGAVASQKGSDEDSRTLYLGLNEFPRDIGECAIGEGIRKTTLQSTSGKFPIR